MEGLFSGRSFLSADDVSHHGRVEQWELARLITLRLAVRVRPLQVTPHSWVNYLPFYAQSRSVISRTAFVLQVNYERICKKVL